MLSHTKKNVTQHPKFLSLSPVTRIRFSTVSQEFGMAYQFEDEDSGFCPGANIGFGGDDFEEDEPSENLGFQEEGVDDFEMKEEKTSSPTSEEMDTVRLISRHVKAQQAMKDLDKRSYDATLNKKQRADKVQDYLIKYHSGTLEPAEKQFVRDAIVLNVWFLFPHVLQSRHFKRHRFDEILQAMVVSILQAIEKFDPSRGTKFTSYIPGYLQSAITKSNVDFRERVVVTPGVSRDELRNRMKQSKLENPFAFDDLTNSTARSVTPAAWELHENLVGTPDVSEDYVQSNEVLRAMSAAMDEQAGILTERERLVISYRYGIFGAPSKTLAEVAHIFHLNGWNATVEWIFQVEKKALVKLRNHFQEKGITEFTLLMQA